MKPQDITYYVCNRHNHQGTGIKYDNITALKSALDLKKETLIQIHGWLDGNNADFNNAVKEAVFSSQDINIIVADWSKVAKGEYLVVKSQISKVSEYIGDFVTNFTKTLGYPVSNIKLVGHSLGAHIAGFIGKHFKGSINQIVGLDPAGPFMDTNVAHRLDKTDAKFVQVIHTSCGKLGMRSQIGHADYYPNGGEDQPGCVLDVVGRCAHLRSFLFYAESLKGNGFYAEHCNSYQDFKNHKCKGAISLMGGYNVDKK